MEKAAATLTASSVHSDCSTEKALLNSHATASGTGWAGAWCASGIHGVHWLQVDLKSLSRIAGVITQGRADGDQWVTSYKLTFSSGGTVWDTYAEEGQDKVFEGNTDRSSPVEHLLVPPVPARFVRFHPLTFYVWPSMRMEVLLCAPECTLWTRWFDRDDTSGTGDAELLSYLRQENPGQICSGPSAIQARVRGTHVQASQTGEQFDSYDKEVGFYCINSDQSDGSCLDYEVRFCCDSGT
ncbi:retinoschisin-like [Branchiostoma floridae]|uniref:Retinoschisin-like n=1 Tax=Branchiostoma floridae TaxID=7739 RepID=A0A9J7KQ71_BRAFL|nr:retinoschisin-like [Branchiostoma floridae]